MAKQTNKKSSKAETNLAVAEPEFLDAPAETIDSEEARFAELLKQAETALDKVENADEDDFEKELDYFWKPQNPGEELKGIYLGSTKAGKLTQHAVAVRNAKGETVAMRFNGTHAVRYKLTPDRVGRGIRLVFQGKTGTANGTQFKNIDVSWL